MIRVWDPLTRAFHWMLAFGFATAWFSAERWEGLHDAAGYFVGALLAFRLIWGFVGGRYARFAQFLRRPSVVIAYLKAIASGSEARFLGHNPAGGAMIAVMLAGLAAGVVTGWMLTTDAFWGIAWAQHLHSAIVHGLVLLIIGHLAGVALASFRHRENLARAMVTGDKRAPAPGDVA